MASRKTRSKLPSFGLQVVVPKLVASLPTCRVLAPIRLARVCDSFSFAGVVDGGSGGGGAIGLISTPAAVVVAVLSVSWGSGAGMVSGRDAVVVVVVLLLSSAGMVPGCCTRMVSGRGSVVVVRWSWLWCCWLALP